MTDIDQLIQINIELEGLLRVLRDRDSAEARNMLADKVEEYTSALDSYFRTAPAQQETEPVADAEDREDAVEEIREEAVAPCEDPHMEEVKDQEAEEAEVEPQAEAAEVAVAAVAADERRQAGPNAKLLKAFTLNDRFRFRRELFAGDDADFTETLKLLADMDSYDEACDYLYNDMMWDRTDPYVADFMAIVAANMPQ